MPGNGNALPTVPTQITRPQNAVPGLRCTSCDAANVLLAPKSAGAPFGGVCSSQCRGGAQYWAQGADPALPFDAVCTNCDDSCLAPGGACVTPSVLAPSTLGALPVSCAACPGTSPLLPAASDPSLNSPFWEGIDAVRGVVPVRLSTAAGRCLPTADCPAGYTKQGTAPTRPNVNANPATPMCLQSPGTANFTAHAATSKTLIVTVCVPAATGAPPVPVGFNSTISPNCSALWGDPWGRDAILANQIAATLGVPPAAVFLRACMDVRLSSHFVMQYGPRFTRLKQYFDADIPAAVANSTRRAGTDCTCDAFATFSVLLSLAAPGEAQFRGTFSSDASTMIARSSVMLGLLVGTPMNTSAGQPLGANRHRLLSSSQWLSGTEGFVVSRNGRSLQSATPTGGYGPLACTFNRTRLLGACYDAYGATEDWDNIRVRNLITLCGDRPPPEVPGSNALPFVVVVSVAAAGSLLGLLFLLALLLLWARRVTARLSAIAAHKAKVARWRKRGRKGGEGVDGLGEDLDDDWDPSSLDAGLTSGKAAFVPTRVAGGAAADGGGLTDAGMELGALPGALDALTAGGVADWAPGAAGRRGGGAGRVTGRRGWWYISTRGVGGEREPPR